MRDYALRIGIAISVLINVITGGELHQSFSARNHEWKRKGKMNVTWLIDLLFLDNMHCLESWTYWVTRKENMRKKDEEPLEIYRI